MFAKGRHGEGMQVDEDIVCLFGLMCPLSGAQQRRWLASMRRALTAVSHYGFGGKGGTRGPDAM